MHEILTVVHGRDILNVLIAYICAYVTYLLKIISISTASGLLSISLSGQKHHRLKIHL